MANALPGNQPPIGGGQADLHLHVQEQDADIEVDVQELPDDIRLGVEGGVLTPPDQIVTDLPDSNTAEGNTMQCLEQALLEEAGQGHLTGRERESALNDLKQGVTKISGKLLKEGDRADSGVVADTYRDPETGKKYYKFLVTWEINVTIDGQEKTIRKSQWTVTGVEQPTNFSKPKYVRNQHHNALLALKCHRHLHKAGMNPQHRDYTYVRDCINDVRDNNLLAPGTWNERFAFTSHLLDTAPKGDDRDWSLKDSVGFDQATNALGITLKNRQGRKVNLYIDTTHQTRKVDETGRKYIKDATDLESQLPEGTTLLGQKHLKQAHLMAVRGNPEIDNYLDIIQAKPEDVEDLLDGMAFEGKNERGMTFSEVKSELLSARKEQARIHKRNAKFAGVKFQGTLMQIYGPKLGDSKLKAAKFMLKQFFYSDKKMTKSMLKSLQNETLTAAEKSRLRAARNELASANDNLRESQAVVKALEHNIEVDQVYADRDIDKETREEMLDNLDEFDPSDVPASKSVKGNDKLIELAGNLLT